jgi:hypothetical protein
MVISAHQRMIAWIQHKCYRQRERERELTCPPSSLSDAERDRAAEIRGWRRLGGAQRSDDSRAHGGAGPGGGDPGLLAKVWRRRLGARGGAVTQGREEERLPELGGDKATSYWGFSRSGANERAGRRRVSGAGRRNARNFGNVASGSRFQKAQSKCIEAAHKHAFPAIQLKNQNVWMGLHVFGQKIGQKNETKQGTDSSNCTGAAHGKAETEMALLPSGPYRGQVASRIRLISHRRIHFLLFFLPHPPRRRTWRRLATAVG